MDEAEMSRYILETFAGVDVVVAAGDSFFFYNPDPGVPPDHKFPFVTIVTSDTDGAVSGLDRPGVFRLNIGVGKETFRARFGTPTLPAMGEHGPATDAHGHPYDFTALDQVMPHPVYGRMYWLCVLSPSEATFATEVQPLLVEAYERAVSTYQRARSRAGTTAP